MTGWAEEPGGGLLARLIADAFERASAPEGQGDDE